MGVSFPNGFSWCFCCSLSWILFWSITGNCKQRGFRVAGEEPGCERILRCQPRLGWGRWGQCPRRVPAPSQELPRAFCWAFFSPITLWCNQPRKHSIVLALGTSTYLQTQTFFKLLQQFPSFPLSGPTAQHMARPFICFNYSCVVEWHLWIIGNVSLQQLFSYTPAALPQTL